MLLIYQRYLHSFDGPNLLYFQPLAWETRLDPLPEVSAYETLISRRKPSDR